VGSVDGASWKNKRLNGVPTSFQVSAHLLEDQPSIPTNKAANVFAHDVARGAFSNNAQHLGPQVAFVFLSLSLSCERVWLAGEPSCEDINSSSVSCRVEFFDVSMLYGVWKMVFQNLAGELLPFAVEEVCPPYPFGSEVEASYPGEKGGMVHTSPCAM